MYKQILTLVLFAAKGKGGGKKKTKIVESESVAGKTEVETPTLAEEEIGDLFDFPFMEEYLSTQEENLDRDGIRESIDAGMESLGIDTGVSEDEEVILKEMKKTYSDIEDLLMRSIDTSKVTDSDMDTIYVPEEGTIGLPVTPQKEIESSQNVIELQVTPARIEPDQEKKQIIELPTKPMQVVEDRSREAVIELPTKPIKPVTKKIDRHIIPLPGLPKAVPGVGLSGKERKVQKIKKEEAVPERKMKPEQSVIAEMMAKRGLLKKPSKGLKKSEKKAVSEKELVRLQELQKKQREAISRRLEEKKVKKVGWGELVDVKKKRFKELNALKKKRTKRRTRYRKEKLLKLQQKEKLEEEREIEERVPARRERTEFRTRERLISTVTVDREDRRESREEKTDAVEEALPPKETMRGAPVVPGVTFAAIKTCPTCGSFINLSVSNKCYSCGKIYK